jgi:thiamine-monophosphate kinase
MNELDVITLFRKVLPVPDEQRNRPFASDAEVVEVGGTLLALTADDFSSEDGFPEGEPRRLGWNLAVATLSDLLAVGAQPAYVMHSVVLAPETRVEGLEEFARGIQDGLEAFGAKLLGGDVGSGREWRYTGIGIGTFAKGEGGPLSRVSSCPSGSLWVTGAFGDGNLAAAGAAETLHLECRMAEARRLRGVAAAAMDTSDGLAQTLTTVSRLNPDLRFDVDLGAIPLDDRILPASRDLGIPPGAFLLGSAGEYELLALLPGGSGQGPEGFRKVGTFSSEGVPGLYFQKEGREVPLPPESLPDPRSYSDRRSYIEAVIRLARELFDGHGSFSRS